jgi:hypothetical protein
MNGTLVIAPALLLEPEKPWELLGEEKSSTGCFEISGLNHESNSGSWFVMRPRI